MEHSAPPTARAHRFPSCSQHPLCLLHPSAQELPTFVLFLGSNKALKKAGESQELVSLVS